MRKIYIVLLLTISVVLTSFAQTEDLQDYDYVVVPNRFDFLFEDDQYDLNSLTVFLFNKYGFNAYLESDLPNVVRCEGLYAYVEGKPGMIYSKITIILNDCNGREVFRGETGRSKHKDYRQAYHQSLREAFKSYEVLNFNQSDPNILKEETVSLEKDLTPTETKKSSASISSLPRAKYSNYVLNNEHYLLKKASGSYQLYKENTSNDALELLGVINIFDDNTLVYTAKNGETYNVSFDSSKNMTLEKDGSKITYSLSL